MKAQSLETWTWVLIYGGLLSLCLGLFVLRLGGGYGWLLVIAGIGLAIAGTVLIFLRARLPETASQNMPPRKD